MHQQKRDDIFRNEYTSKGEILKSTTYESWDENDFNISWPIVAHGMGTMRSIKHKTNHLDTNYHVTLTISETKSVSLWKPCRPFGLWFVVQPFIFREGDPLVGGWVGSGFAIAKWWLWVHLVWKNYHKPLTHHLGAEKSVIPAANAHRNTQQPNTRHNSQSHSYINHLMSTVVLNIMYLYT